MRAASLHPIGDMAKLRCESFNVFPCFVRPQSDDCGHAEADKEEDNTESKLHVENGLVTGALAAHKSLIKS